jgi:hypothetical protein
MRKGRVESAAAASPLATARVPKFWQTSVFAARVTSGSGLGFLGTVKSSASPEVVQIIKFY